MSDETPQWAASLPGAAVKVDDDQRLLIVEASRCEANLQFGEVDPGWTIQINSAGTSPRRPRPQTIDVAASPADVRWLIALAPAGDVTLGPGIPGASLSTTKSSSASATIKLTVSGQKFTFEAGTYAIRDGRDEAERDGPDRLSFAASIDGADGNETVLDTELAVTELTGSAARVTIRGTKDGPPVVVENVDLTGDLSVLGSKDGPPAVVENVNLTGDLSVQGIVGGDTAHVTGSLDCHKLCAAEVAALRLVVDPGSARLAAQMLDAVNDVRRLDADMVEVKGRIQGQSGTPTQVSVAQQFSARQVDHVEVAARNPAADDNSGDEGFTVEVEQQAADLRVRGRCTSMLLGSVTGLLDTEVAGEVEITGKVSGGELHLKAVTVNVGGDLAGQGTVSADTVAIDGEVHGEDGLVISARSTIHLSGTPSGACLISDGDGDDSIQLGLPLGKRSHQLALTKPSTGGVVFQLEDKAPESVVPVRHKDGDDFASRAPGNLAEQRVAGCVLLSDGGIRIFQGVSGSLIAAAGTVQVGSVLSTRSADLEALRNLVPEEHQRRLLAVTDAHLSAATLHCVNTVELGQHHTVRVTDEISAPAIRGEEREEAGEEGEKTASVQVSGDGGYAVFGTCSDVRIEASHIAIAKDVDRSSLDAKDALRLSGSADEMSSLVSQGNVLIDQRLSPDLTWEPKPHASCWLLGGAQKVVVEGPSGKERPQLLVDPQASAGDQHPVVGDLKVRGMLALAQIPTEDRGSSNSQSKAAPRVIGNVTFVSNGNLDVRISDQDIGTVHLAGPGTLGQGEAAGKKPGSTTPCKKLTFRLAGQDESAHRLTLSVRHQDSRFRLLPAEQEREDGRRTATSPIDLRSGELHVETVVPDLGCPPLPAGESGAGPGPVLSVAMGGAVESVAGEFRLARNNGRIVGADGLGYVERWFRSRWKQLRGTEESPDGPQNPPVPQPARILKVVASKDGEVADRLAGGRLEGVDLSLLEAESIPRLAHLHVLDPDGPSLMAHAAGHEVGDDEDADGAAAKRDRAQRMLLVAEAVAKKASSGSSRSAVMWSAARAHHRAARRRLERGVRWLPAAVGYGQRPGPALLALGLWTTVVAGILLALDPEPNCPNGDSFADPPYGYWQQFQRVLFAPAGLLRLEVGGALPYAPVGCEVGWHLLVFAGTAFLLASAAVSIRNFLRSPADAKFRG